MNAAPSKEIFEEVAQIWGTTEYFIEKDWYAVQVISAISNLNHPSLRMVFSGGTCLSKAHGLIERFSEDVDFRVMNEGSTLSKNSLSNYKKSVVDTLLESGCPIKGEDVRARNGNKFFEIAIRYQTLFPESAALRPHILLEVTVDSPNLALIELPIQSFVSQVLNLSPEVSKISCISPLEIGADKLSAITWRIPDRIRGGECDDPTLVRHIYDLSKLEGQLVNSADFYSLVLSSFQKDNHRPKVNPTFSTLSLAEKLQIMVDILETDTNYSDEYYRFVRGNSYTADEKLVNFDEAKKALRRLVNHVIEYKP